MPEQRGVRLAQVYSHDADNAASVDIIAIHGLDTNSRDTWTWRSNGFNRPSVNWISDTHMLPSIVGPARIFTCDWPARLSGPRSSMQMVLREFARLILAAVMSRDANNGTTKANRPIVFIASCLGGIVLMQALVMADNDYAELKTSIRGIIFLATPFQGISFKDVLGWALFGLQARTYAQRETPTTLLDVAMGNFDLDELVRQFTQLLSTDAGFSCQVQTFYELGVTKLYNKLPLAQLCPTSLMEWISQPKQLVSKSSATLQIVSNPLPLNRSHVMMNKFSDPDETDYRIVTGEIQRMLSKIREFSLLKADTYIVAKHYTPERLKIVRLSGEELDLDSCYINLAIVKPSENGGDPLDGNEASGSSRLSYFQGSEDKENLVNLKDLFDKPISSNTSISKRILIRGRAGVGKTTLCKKIVYEFINRDMWKELFDRLLWVPLRRLKKQAVNGYNMKNLFYEEYFSQAPDGHKLASSMWKSLSDINFERTLFLLDGLDEITELLDSDDEMFPFLRELLNQPNSIITSRPYTSLPGSFRSVELKVETVGFYTGQITEYIAAVTENSRKAAEINSFLKRRRLMSTLVRIPIQLDALCYIWSDFETDIPQTMTAVYAAIELKLWRKDIVKLGKVSQHSIKPLRNRSHIMAMVAEENQLLEVLAFSALYSDMISFDSKQRDIVYEHMKPSSKVHIWDNVMSNLSFLRTSSPLTKFDDQSYHFIHLTFQEYFAARYFVRQWCDEKELTCLSLTCATSLNMNPKSFIRKFKYQGHYYVFWRFVAGLLDARGMASSLFQEIESKPRDILGFTHQKLVMHCLSEVSKDMSMRKGLEKMLLRWTTFRYDTTAEIYSNYLAPNDLACDNEFPERIFCTILQKGPDRFRKRILKSIHGRAEISPRILQRLASYLEHKDKEIQEICTALIRNQSPLPLRVLCMVITRLKHESKNVRAAALGALSDELELPDNVIRLIGTRLSDEDPNIREQAILVLAAGPRSWSSSTNPYANLSYEILKEVAARLEDCVERIRDRAIVVLHRQTRLPADIVKIVAAYSIGSKKPDSLDTSILFKQLSLSQDIIEILGARPAKQPGKDVDDASTKLPHALLVIVKNLDYCDISEGDLAIEILRRYEPLPPAVVDGLFECLRGDNFLSRRIAVTLLSHSHGLERFFQKSVIELEDINLDTRRAASLALSAVPELPDDIMHKIGTKLDDHDRSIRLAALLSLSTRSNLPQEIVSKLHSGITEKKDEITRLPEIIPMTNQGIQSAYSAVAIFGQHDIKDAHFNWMALNTVVFRKFLGDELLIIVAQWLRHPEKSWRSRASNILRNHKKLSDNVLEAISAPLKNVVTFITEDTLKVLSEQTFLPQSVIKNISEWLCSAKIDGVEAFCAWNIFEKQVQLPVDVLHTIAEASKNPDWQVGARALEFLRRQPKLPHGILKMIGCQEHVAYMNLMHYFMFLDSHPVLPREVLNNVRTQFCQRGYPDLLCQLSAECLLKKHNIAYRSLVNRRRVGLLYATLFKHALIDDWMWYVDDGTSFMRLNGATRPDPIYNPQQFMHDIMKVILHKYPKYPSILPRFYSKRTKISRLGAQNPRSRDRHRRILHHTVWRARLGRVRRSHCRPLSTQRS